LCITIMCGAISGFHALIASGTTSKMVYRESAIKAVGYGAMLLESFVAVMALVAACALEPGDYFAINSPAPAYSQALQTQAANGWDLAHKDLRALEAHTNETLEARPGGAVTLAVGMAKIFSSLPGMETLTSYWYHFVIMFEALFILTLLETGTRVARFVFQETAAGFMPADRTKSPALLRWLSPERGRINWALNIGMSLLVCFLWGYLLYRGDLGILWKMLGIVNQLLAGMALAVGTTYILLRSPRRAYALCTGLPFVFVIVTTYWASFLNLAAWWGEQKQEADPDKVFLLKLVCALSVIMLVLVTVLVADALRRWAQILRQKRPRPNGSYGSNR
jgi:carbon starvation protein